MNNNTIIPCMHATLLALFMCCKCGLILFLLLFIIVVVFIIFLGYDDVVIVVIAILTVSERQ